MRRARTALVLSLLVVTGLSSIAAPVAAAGDDTLVVFGDAGFAGSTSGLQLSQPLVGMAARPDGAGYWLVARDGGVFSFAGASFLGSTGAIRLNQPIVGMASTPSGLGYWLVAADGGVFTFGDAPFLGSAAPHNLAKAAVGIAPTPAGDGYWIAAGDGSMYAFGAARWFGNAPAGHAAIRAVAAAPDGRGYLLLGEDGGVFAFGTSVFSGSAAGRLGFGRIALDLATTPTGRGYWVLTGPPPVLVPGMSGSPVRELQAQLQGLGYWVPIDGRFGHNTTQALYALQKAAGIPRTGVFDAATQRALAAGVVPVPRSTSGRVVEVDKTRQLLLVVSNGRLIWAMNTSTGNGATYRTSSGGRAVAVTPEGWFSVYHQINGLRISDLGELWRPKYFVGGYAVHGSPSIPPYPASHGCVRLSNAAMNFLWDSGLVPLGTSVYVYR